MKAIPTDASFQAHTLQGGQMRVGPLPQLVLRAFFPSEQVSPLMNASLVVKLSMHLLNTVYLEFGGG